MVQFDATVCMKHRTEYHLFPVQQLANLLLFSTTNSLQMPPLIPHRNNIFK